MRKLSVNAFPAKAPQKKSHAGYVPHRIVPKKAAAKSPPRKAAPVRLPNRQQPIDLAHPTDKVSPCGIGSDPSGNEKPTRTIGGSTPPDANKAPPLTPNEAYAKMKDVRKIDGVLVKSAWTPKAFATLAACLAALDAWEDDKTACDAIRNRLKKERGARRALNCNNPYLVAIHCCHEKPTRAQRTEFTRFSKVVEVARHQKVKPAQAQAWLEPQTQATILAQARALKGKAPVSRAPIASKNVRPLIWKAIQAGKGEMFDFVVKRLDALEERLEYEF